MVITCNEGGMVNIIVLDSKNNFQIHVICEYYFCLTSFFNVFSISIKVCLKQLILKYILLDIF